MSRKVIFLTGSSSGIGFELLKKFSSENHQLILPIRNLSEKKEFVSFLENIYPEPLYFEYDLSKPENYINNQIDSILEKNFDYVDILIHNAGIFTQNRKLIMNYELQWVVNFFSTVHITFALTDLLKRSSFPQILFISSRIHRLANIDFEDFNYKKKYSARIAYANSKFAMISFAMFLADRYPDIYINSIHPGVYETGITRELSLPVQFLWNAFIKEPVEGAEIIYRILMNKNYQYHTKKYFNQLKIEEPHPLVYNSDIQKNLIQQYNLFLNSIRDSQ